MTAISSQEDAAQQESFVQRLLASVKAFSLSESEFYKAWSAGTLPQDALRLYAEEYGAFIATLPGAWKVQDDEETAHEEEEHIELWDRFAASIGTKRKEAGNVAMRALIAESGVLFSDPVTALGALYAFEVQQPETSVSKIEGLDRFYSDLKADQKYFEEHSRNHHEAEKLIERIGRLFPIDRERAMAACDRMSRSLRAALDGLYHCV